MAKRILLLSESEVKQALEIEDFLETAELAFKEKALGKTQMPPKSYLFFERYGGDLRTMPSYIESLNISGVKVVNAHPDNPKKYGLPSIIATMILADPQTGSPLAIMGCTWITAMRTGAAGAIATKHLGRPNSRVLALVGAGVQASAQLKCISAVLPHLEEVRVTDLSDEALRRFIEVNRRQFKFRFTPCEDVKRCVEGADVVSTQTPSRAPIVESSWISPGTHINAIGADAPGKQELDPLLLKRARIFVDDVEQAIHSGEMNVPFRQGFITKDDIRGELGEVLTGAKIGRTSDDEITIFDSTGLSLQDVSAAERAYRKARAAKLGRWVTLND
ncbi:MAG: alanine dehydrogenase [Candidatus Bathyarchaeia archaeon]